MKKTLLFVVTLLFANSLIFAQEASKIAKKAGRDLVAFEQDRSGNAEKLTEARAQIDEAYSMDPNDPNVLETRGDIYAAITIKETTAIQLQQDVKLDDKNIPAVIAIDAYTKMLDVVEKKWQKKKAIEGIQKIQGSCNNYGSVFYQKQNLALAFNAFKAQLDAHKVLKDNNKESVLDDAGLYNDQLYIVALAAMGMGDYDTAEPYLLESYKTGNAQAAVYQGLFKLNLSRGKQAEAEKIMAEGRTKYPDDTELLFEEINYFLKEGKLDVLTDRLKSAIEKEPDNVTLYATLAQVYDNLYGSYVKEGNKEKADEYFDLAKNTYEEAIEKNPKSSEAQYGLGALYYNVAAFKTQEIQSYADDYSDAATKKIAAIEKEVESLFAKSLPYFKKAESLNPNDQNTLIALKEIFARTNEFELSKEFKGRLENVQSGGTNKSYFK